MQELNLEEFKKAQNSLIRYCGDFTPFIAEKASGII
jgi:2,2-dialkylglycine decarboxylase (pyruvate)